MEVSLLRIPDIIRYPIGRSQTRWDDLIQEITILLLSAQEITHFRIVGLQYGFASKHKNATSIMDFSFSSTSPKGGGRRESIKSLTTIFMLAAGAGRDRSKERKSPGCFPSITSSTNTPKLNTSHFSFAFIV